MVTRAAVTERANRQILALIVTLAATATLPQAALSHSGTASRSSTLDAKEQKWVQPLLRLYAVETAHLKFVVRQASETNALVQGSGKHYNALAITIIVFEECGLKLKSAGNPPTVRLVSVQKAFAGACTHLYNGGHQFALAIRAVTAGQKGKVNGLLTTGVAEFKQARKFLISAQKQLITLGGKNIFTA